MFSDSLLPHLRGGVVGRIMPPCPLFPKATYILTRGNCEYVWLHAEERLQMELRLLIH